MENAIANGLCSSLVHIYFLLWKSNISLIFLAVIRWFTNQTRKERNNWISFLYFVGRTKLNWAIQLGINTELLCNWKSLYARSKDAHSWISNWNIQTGSLNCFFFLLSSFALTSVIFVECSFVRLHFYHCKQYLFIWTMEFKCICNKSTMVLSIVEKP